MPNLQLYYFVILVLLDYENVEPLVNNGQFQVPLSLPGVGRDSDYSAMVAGKSEAAKRGRFI